MENWFLVWVEQHGGCFRVMRMTEEEAKETMKKYKQEGKFYKPPDLSVTETRNKFEIVPCVAMFIGEIREIARLLPYGNLSDNGEMSWNVRDSKR